MTDATRNWGSVSRRKRDTVVVWAAMSFARSNKMMTVTSILVGVMVDQVVVWMRSLRQKRQNMSTSLVRAQNGRLQLSKYLLGPLIGLRFLEKNGIVILSLEFTGKWIR